jgi:excisionase family DNA binding protein
MRVKRTSSTASAQDPQRAAPRDSYLLPGEVAEILAVSPKTVSRWAQAGKLPCCRTLGGHRRFPESEIRELRDSLQVW